MTTPQVPPGSSSSSSGSPHSSNVAKQAGLMGIATFLSRIGGLVREQVFAFMFGASDVADAFNIAFRIPNLLRDLFAEGAMSAAFVPNFTRSLAQSRDSAFKLLMAVLWSLFIGLSILSLVGIFFSPELVALYASKFKSVPGKFELTVSLTRVMFPFFPLVAMAAVAMGALNALGFFFLPAFAPVLFNIASVFAGLVVCPLLERFTYIHPIYGMASGVVVGGFLQFYIQWRQVRREGLSLQAHWVGSHWTAPWKIPGVAQVMWLLVPGTVGLAATQLNILINSMYATSRGTGAVSYLNYAFRLMQFPIGIFGVSLAAATLPQVTRALANKNQLQAGSQINASLRMTMAVNGPAAAGLMGLGLPLIQLLFEHGLFTPFASIQTNEALFWYSLGLPGYSAVKILGPVFYALGSTRVPVIASFAMVGLNAVLNYIFVYHLQLPFWALALATSVTATLNAVVLLVYLSRRIPGIVNPKIMKSLCLYGVVSVVIWAICQGAIGIVDLSMISIVKTAGPTLRGFLSIYWPIWTLKLVLGMGFSAIAWLAMGRIFKLEEIEGASQIFLKKLRKLRAP